MGVEASTGTARASWHQGHADPGGRSLRQVSGAVRKNSRNTCNYTAMYRKGCVQESTGVNAAF